MPLSPELFLFYSKNTIECFRRCWLTVKLEQRDYFIYKLTCLRRTGTNKQKILEFLIQLILTSRLNSLIHPPAPPLQRENKTNRQKRIQSKRRKKGSCCSFDAFRAALKTIITEAKPFIDIPQPKRFVPLSSKQHRMK